MDAAKWSQGFQDIGLVKPMEEMVSNSCNNRSAAMLEKKQRPPEQLNCPRCNSTNTKFCYYNNYSLTQPRYFCKTCRRYWTEGGSLRNVPVGGGSRKNKRASPKIPDLNPTTTLISSSQNPKSGQDLNLGFPSQAHNNNHHLGGMSQYLQLPKMGLSSSFIPPPSHDSATLYSDGYSVQDYKPTFGFCIDGVGNRGANNNIIHGVEENGGRVFFPFVDQMKIISSSSNEVDHRNKGQDGNNSAGYWNNNSNGVLGGGSW